jgi:hypothetical protein
MLNINKLIIMLSKIKNHLIAFINNCIKTIFFYKTWTVVLNEYKTEKDGKLLWTKEYCFYNGNLQTQNIDWNSDWRFCEVKDKRKQAKILGVCKTKFPIKYPLYLTNGIVI